MRIGVWAWTVAVGLWAGTACAGTPMAHQVWTADDGLPLDHATAVARTPDGFLWVATYDGLARYDGNGFDRFTTANSELPRNRVAQMQVDGRGRLWLGFESPGLARLDAATGQFVPVDHAPVRRPAGDFRGEVVWFETAEGLGRYDDALSVFPVPEGVELADIEARGEDVWMATADGGAVHWDGQQMTRYPGRDLDREGRHIALAGGSVWVGTTAGVDRLVDGTWEPVTLDGAPWTARVANLAELDGALLVQTNGLFQVAPGGEPEWIEASGTRRRSTRDLVLGPYLLTADRVIRDGQVVWRAPPQDGTITTGLLDDEGSLWLTTTRRGLHRLRPTPLRSWTPEDGLCTRSIEAVASHGGAIYASASNGCAVKIDGASIERLDPVLEDSSVIGEGPDGELLFGSGRGRLHDLAGVARHAVSEASEARWITAVLAAADTLWVGTTSGLYAGTGTPMQAAITDVHVRALAEDHEGRVWVSTAGAGVWTGGPDGFVAVPGPSAVTRGILPLDDGTVWVGSEDAGLIRIDGAAEPPTVTGVVGPAQGLPHHGVHALLDDGVGGLWGSTNRGLFRVSRADLERLADGEDAPGAFVRFGVGEGMPSAEANGTYGSSATRHDDGTLWFATQGGLVWVDPAEWTARPELPPPPMAWTELSVGPTSHPVGRPLVLTSGHEPVSVSWAALSFASPARVRYRTRLSPLEAEYRDAGPRRSTELRRLVPGNYTFEVQGTNADGVWSEVLALPIEVRPRWFETAAFRLLVVAVTVLLILAWVRWRLWTSEERQRELEREVSIRTVELEEQRTAAEEGRRVVARQAEELRALDDAKSRFFANISHEFRTPLTLMIGPLEDLRTGRHGTLGERPSAQVSLALRNARGMLGLVDQLLDVARLDAGTLSMTPHPGDLVPFLAAVHTRFRPLAERCGLTFPLDLPDVAAPASFDVLELEKVVGNLLSNAIKFTPEGGEVRLTLALEDDRAVVTVSDTGPGIPTEAQDRLFDRFYRSEGAPAATAPGTGLGLSVAREVVALHGGELTLENAPERGASFRLTLPTIPGAQLDAVVGPEVESDVAAAGEGPLVLVVDDHRDIRAFVRSVLEPELRVIEAEDGVAGLTLARTETPDLVLSDVMMPKMDGVALCRALKGDPETAFIPVVLLTARADQGHRVEALSSGADDYLQKPFEPRELRARLQNLVLARQRAMPVPQREDDEDAVVSADEAYIGRVREVIGAELHDPDFNVAALARAMGQDRSSLYRRVFAVTATKPSVLIRTLRLERAARLLRGEAGGVSEIAYGVGFASLSSFSRAFKQHFGCSPSKYAASGP